MVEEGVRLALEHEIHVTMERNRKQEELRQALCAGKPIKVRSFARLCFNCNSASEPMLSCEAAHALGCTESTSLGCRGWGGILLMDAQPKKRIALEDGASAEEEMLVEVFQRIDLDGSGLLDRDELTLAMAQMGRSEAETSALLERVEVRLGTTPLTPPCCRSI